MLKKIDIYNFDQKLDRYMRKLNDMDISSETKADMALYRDHLLMSNLSKARVVKHLETVFYIMKYSGKDINTFSKPDISQFLASLHSRDLSPWTHQMYKVSLRKYFTWKNDGKMPDSVSWIKVHCSNAEKKLPGEGEFLSEDDVKLIMSMCDNTRDKCLISILYESGCRIGEIASLHCGNIKFDNYGVVITVIGKTGSRKIRLVQSTSFLKAYLDNHPNKDLPSACLWINRGCRNHGKPMMYYGFRMIVKRLCDKAGIKKKCNPHMFRHSRATQLANHLTEFQMNQYFGWIQGSDMPSTYVHLSGRDVDNAILSMNGIKTEINNEIKFKPIQCPRCEMINPAETKYCTRCEHILDAETAAKHEETVHKKKIVNMIMNEIVKEPSIRQHLLSRVSELGLSEEVLNFQ